MGLMISEDIRATADPRSISSQTTDDGHSGTPIRSLFVSDVHLGCRYTNAESFLRLLHEFEPEYLYIVGDFVDGWRLQRRWYWSHVYGAICQRLIELRQRGTHIVYTPGNHDDFLRGDGSDFAQRLHETYCLASIADAVQDEIIHRCIDGRLLLVTHGDQFDTVIRKVRWLSKIGDVGYQLLLMGNRLFNTVRLRLGMNYWSFSAYVKKRVKQATNAISDFEQSIAQHAVERGCHGVVCGHIHTPVIRQHGDGTYYNTGDWVENCTALVEDSSGSFRLIRRPNVVQQRFHRTDLAPV